MASIAHIPTQALVAAFGDDWLQTLSQASPDINFDNVIKTKKSPSPKLSPSQRNSVSFDHTKCHARVISEVKDDQGRPIYKKTGKIHPGYIDMQCSSRQANGSCFCKRHSLIGGGNGNLGKFSEPRPEIIKYPKHPDDQWLWADDPRSEEYRRSDDHPLPVKKPNTSQKPKTKTKTPQTLYDDVPWTNIAQDTKMKKDLALCYLQHHNISTTDSQGKNLTIGNLRKLVRDHFYGRTQDKQDNQTNDNDSDDTLQKDESEDSLPSHDDSPQTDHSQPSQNLQTTKNNPTQDQPDKDPDQDLSQQDLPQQDQHDQDDDDDDDDHDDFEIVEYQEVKYKRDGFNDVYNIEDLVHMGSWDSEKNRIIFENNEAKLLHLENYDNINYT